MEISESFRNGLGKLGGRFALLLTHVIHDRPDLWVWGLWAQSGAFVA
jgi:hypothetical protein